MPQHAALILTVGMTHEPVTYSIRQAGAQAAAFICTPESEQGTLNQVIAETGLLPAAYRKYIVPDGPQHIGRVCTEFYHAYRWLTEERGLPRDQIGTDPTAGRKWMSAGATMIAAHLGLAMHYVDVQFKAGKPDPATMKMVELGNAYDQTGFVEAEKARIFFNSYAFATASEIFAAIQPSLSAQADLYGGLTALAKALDRWDRFEHYKDSLKADFDAAIVLLRRCLTSEPTAPPAFMHFVQQASDLAAAIEDLHLGPRPAPGFTVDVFENARRRVLQNSYDDACGRLYRTLESLSQLRLLTAFGIDTAKADYAKLSDEERAAVAALFGSGLPNPVDLATGFKVLKVLNDDLGKAAIKGKNFSFQGLLNDRDHSILAHGFDPIGRARVSEFLKRLEDELLKPILGDKYLKWSSRLRVPKLPRFLA